MIFCFCFQQQAHFEQNKRTYVYACEVRRCFRYTQKGGMRSTHLKFFTLYARTKLSSGKLHTFLCLGWIVDEAFDSFNFSSKIWSSLIYLHTFELTQLQLAAKAITCRLKRGLNCHNLVQSFLVFEISNISEQFVPLRKFFCPCPHVWNKDCKAVQSVNATCKHHAVFKTLST